MIHTARFRDVEFSIVEGKTHPGFSLNTFDEERAFREEHWCPEKDDVVIDAGASYGSYTLSALALGAKVYAFEPEKDIAHDLLVNIAINNWRTRGTVLQMGLWDCRGGVRIYEYATHWPAHTSPEPLQMVSLDDWASREELTRLDWLKMDIEGAEERAVRGGIETIEKFKPRLIIEAHTFLDADIPRKIRAMLPGYSFDEYPREPCVMMVGRAA